MPAPPKKRQDDPNISYQRQARGAEHCAACTMFVRPSSCSLVDGFISVFGWCKAFDPKRLPGERKHA